MPQAARRSHQVDASQSSLRPVSDQWFVGRSSTFAVRTDRENQPVAVRIRTLHLLSAAGDRLSDVSFQLLTCYFDPGFCQPKPWSVVLYRATKSTKNPNSQWVTEQAREFAEQTKTREHRPTHLVHDRDTKFSAEFKAALKEEGIECKRLPVRSPNLNARVERVIQAIKHEVLNHFIVLGRDHLDYLVKTYATHHNTNRPHSHRNHRPPCDQADVPEWTSIKLEDVECREQLGGVIKSMHRKAA